MVNASMHFDTVSIYALTASDAKEIPRYVKPSMIEMLTGARTQQNPLGKPENLRIAIPKTDDLEFFEM